MTQNLNEMSIPEVTAELTYGTWKFQKGWKPMHVVDAEGCHFTDSNGTKFLDFSSQLMCCLLGHKNQAVIEAICEQARTLPYIAPGFATDVRVELSKLLVECLPEGLNKFFFTTSGTEANEAAFKIARMVTGKTKIIARYRSYHGSTMGSIAATGDFRRWAMEPAGKIPGVLFAPECHCYKCPMGHTYPDCKLACAKYIDHMIANESDVAAILVEPVVGTNGILIPPDDYMPLLRKICDKHNVLLIADEVMSGWGRTGKWFAMDHWGVKPDIITTAKGITGAYVPLGLCVTTQKIAEHFDSNFFSHGHTYEAHPITLAPAIAAINELKRLDLLNRSTQMGQYMKTRLDALKDKHPSVGDIRGIGLFWAVDLVKNRDTREPFNTYADKAAGKVAVIDQVAGKIMQSGVFLHGWVSHLVIAPPLIITEEEIDRGVAAIDEALVIADKAITG